MSLTAEIPESVIEWLHGVPVSDPYRWLENRQSDATHAWILEQHRLHDAYFACIPEFDTLREYVSAYLNVENLDQPMRTKSSLFYRRRKKDQEQPCIYVTDSSNGIERVLVDASMLGPFASVDIHHLSRDASLLAFGVREGGSDAKTIHIMDVATARTLPDSLPTSYPRGFGFSPDNLGFYYCHDMSLSSPEHQVCFHRIGEPSASDRVLFRIARNSRTRLRLLADDNYLGLLYTHEVHTKSVNNLYLAKIDSNPAWSQVFSGRPSTHRPFLHRGRLFAFTDDGTERGSVIELRLDGTYLRTIVPESDSAIQQMAFSWNSVYVGYLVDGVPAVHRWSIEGHHIGPVHVPANCTVALHSSQHSDSDSLFYTAESFTEPLGLYEYVPREGCSHQLSAKSDAGKTEIRCDIRKSSYPSSDGTKIPITVVRRNCTELVLPRPTIMTSYGGFGVTMTPKFSVLVAVLLDLGAVLALPGIRGGSEFGKQWHEAARGRNRQVSFDDFIAAAEWLCKQNITQPRQLAIFGGSNSGLLVGCALTQRPDLFRAVLCIAPLLDMVRYERFNRAAQWKAEYGTVEDPDDFAALHSYSPYHHVEEHTNYPATLFVCGDSDDRCNPAHVRKMAARLQQRSSQAANILVDYSSERGHSPVLPLSFRIEALARRLAFLCHELSIKIQ